MSFCDTLGRPGQSVLASVTGRTCCTEPADSSLGARSVCYNNKHRMPTTLLPSSRSGMWMFGVNACNQEAGSKSECRQGCCLVAPETQILLLSDSRPHTYWKKSNRQKMGKTDGAYETNLVPMPHWSIWVFIRQESSRLDFFFPIFNSHWKNCPAC